MAVQLKCECVKEHGHAADGKPASFNADFRRPKSTHIFDESSKRSTEVKLNAVSVEPGNLATVFVEGCFAEDGIMRAAIK